MAVTGFKGINARQALNEIIFDAFIQYSSGPLISTGTCTLSILDMQSDGTIDE